MMKDYKAIYEKMDARRKRKFEEMASMEAAIKDKEQEIMDLDEEIANLERELADIIEFREECAKEYERLATEAENKKILGCIAAVINKALFRSNAIPDAMKLSYQASNEYNSSRFAFRKGVIDEEEFTKQIYNTAKQVVTECERARNN